MEPPADDLFSMMGNALEAQRLAVRLMGIIAEEHPTIAMSAATLFMQSAVIAFIKYSGKAEALPICLDLIRRGVIETFNEDPPKQEE